MIAVLVGDENSGNRAGVDAQLAQTGNDAFCGDACIDENMYVSGGHHGAVAGGAAGKSRNSHNAFLFL